MPTEAFSLITEGFCFVLVNIRCKIALESYILQITRVIIISGIDDKNGKIVEMENNEGRMDKQNLQDFLRSKPFAQNFYPLTYRAYSPTKQEKIEIDVITIFNENNVPLCLDKDIAEDYKLNKN